MTSTNIYKFLKAVVQILGYVIPYCYKTDPNAKRGVNCVLDSDTMGAINIFKLLKPELNRLVLTHKCSDASVKPYMTEGQVVNYMKKIYPHLESHEIQEDLKSFELLVFKNPGWDISVVQADDGYISDASVVTTMDNLILNRESKTIGLTVFNPDVPWKCSLYNKLYAVINTALVIAVGSLILYGTNVGYKFYRKYEQSERDEVFQMVERIVDILQSNCTEGGDSNFLVVNHVRDMILPIKNRKRMEKIWDKAVTFISDHESRVRTEVQIVQGEQYEVWRWLGSPSLNTSGSPRTKTWQGQAFETQVGSVNSLPCSPTPCLKIRGMLDDNDSNLHSIREAVLSKCAHQCRILHCAVDKASKCVYLKCADQGEAAIAYQNLHGWWYAGHLVTVKYLRLERYMQRFPDSPAKGPPFLKSISPATDWRSETK